MRREQRLVLWQLQHAGQEWLVQFHNCTDGLDVRNILCWHGQGVAPLRELAVCCFGQSCTIF